MIFHCVFILCTLCNQCINKEYVGLRRIKTRRFVYIKTPLTEIIKAEDNVL